jgi:hypothetical protein
VTGRTSTNSAGRVRTTTFNLDEFECEDDPGPFAFILGGRSYEMVDPHAVDYRDLTPILLAARTGDVVKALSGMLDPDDVEAFWENKIPAFKLNAIGEGWLNHYKLAASPRL